MTGIRTPLGRPVSPRLEGDGIVGEWLTQSNAVAAAAVGLTGGLSQYSGDPGWRGFNPISSSS